MTYHVLVKVRYLESGFEDWYTYFDVCAENESEAVLKGKERFLVASVPDEVEAIEFRALEAKPGERFSLCEQSKVFELEDYEKNALGSVEAYESRIAVIRGLINYHKIMESPTIEEDGGEGNMKEDLYKHIKLLYRLITLLGVSMSIVTVSLIIHLIGG